VKKLDNIVNFGDFKEKKSKQESKTNHSTATYFIMLGNEEIGTSKFRFGGAFMRDFINRVKEHKEELKAQVTISYKLMLERLKAEENPSEFVSVYLGMQTLKGIVDLLLDEFSFDPLFDEEHMASQAGLVMGIAIFSYYLVDELETMQQNEWIDCDLETVESIFNTLHKGSE
jgi:hypothetical protein